MMKRMISATVVSIALATVVSAALADTSATNLTVVHVQDGGSSTSSYGFIEIQVSGGYPCMGTNDNDNLRYIYYDNPVHIARANGIRSVALAAMLSGRMVRITAWADGNYCRISSIRMLSN